MKLSFYLFESSVVSFESAIDEAKLEGDAAYEEVDITAELEFEAKAYLQKNRQTTPKWIRFFDSHLALPDDIKNANNSLLFLIKVQSRYFAITAGYGFAAINRRKIEPDFGLRVTLNTIDKEKLKGVDSRRIDTHAAQKRLLVSAEGPLGDFDFDIDEDLVSMISGTPRDGAFAKRLVGGDSLSLTGDYTLPQLGAKCEDLLDAFKSEAYRENFEFIDHLRLVKDKDLCQTLENLLNAALTNRQTDKFLLAYPELDFWTSAEEYKVTGNYRSEQIPDIDIDLVYECIDSLGIEEVDCRKIKLIGLNGDGEAVTTSRTLLDYAVFETDHEGGRLLLSLGKWFRLAADYIEEVDDFVRSVEVVSETDYLPCIDAGVREDAYSRNAVTADRICMDKGLFHAVPGRSKIEVCDLLTRQGEFIVVKKYNASSTLSHMFSQGFVSAELFNDHREYREFVEQQRPTDWETLFDLDNPEKENLTFVFAIAGIREGNFAETLPFFSKVNLRHFVRGIKRMSYRVKLCRIPLSNAEEVHEEGAE